MNTQNTYNLPNLLKLKAFFDAGAPHYHIKMNIPFGLLKDPEMVEVLEFYREAVPTDCGSAGCIAGAAFQVLNPNWHLDIPEVGDWDTIKQSALELLGLNSQESAEVFYGHNLFDPNMAPDNVTAAQCAVAIQNVIDGKHPWN